MARVMVGIPTHGRQIDAGMLLASHQMGDVGRVEIKWSASSLLAHNHNKLLCAAKNGGFDWLLIWHGDVAPLGDNWLAGMIAGAEVVGADVLGAVIPIKSASGMTSTAVMMSDGVRRLTMREVYRGGEQFIHIRAQSYGASALLVNTGLMLLRLEHINPTAVNFTIVDRVQNRGAFWEECYWPEDWGFSLAAQQFGLSVWATREPRVEHVGAVAYSTAAVPWGEATDTMRGEVLT